MPLNKRDFMLIGRLVPDYTVLHPIRRWCSQPSSEASNFE